MDTTKQLTKAVINKDFAEAKDLLFKSLYARASLALDEVRYSVADAVFNSTEEITEDYQTAAREREVNRKVKKHEDKADSGLAASMKYSGKAGARGRRQETKHQTALLGLLKRAGNEQESPRTYGRGGKLIKKGSRAEVQEEVEMESYGNPFTPGVAGTFASPNFRGGLKAGDKVKVPHKGKTVKGKIVRFDDGGTDKHRQHGGGYVVDVGEYSSITVPHHKIVKEGTEQIDELSKGTKDAYVAKRGSQLSSMMYGPEKNRNLLTGRKQANAVKGIKRATGVKEENEVSEEWKSLKKTKADLNAIRKSGKRVSVQHGEGDTLYRVSKPKKSVKEEIEQIDEVMTRRHFQQVADVIKAHPDAKKREELATHHSQIFKKSNPRFDEGRFRKACGLGGCK